MTIIEDFENNYRAKPSFLVNVPGRVNLIGEHIDYNGFPVLPISIPYTITVAGSVRQDNEINCKNTDNSFPVLSFEISPSIPHSQPGSWDNYIKAAIQALTTSLDKHLHGVNLLFEGSIPRSAGLSSSSALVIASALSLLAEII